MLNNRAPEFALDSTTGNQVRLSDFSGSFVVLIFYPANETPTCNSQLADMNINLQEFFENNARVFGVNTASVEAHRTYCERRRLEFPILSDKGGLVAKQYNANRKWLPMFIRRTVVAIDPDGVICFYENGKPDPKSVLDAIKDRARQRVTNQ
jgi:peroxiredoxin Q/BCP